MQQKTVINDRYVLSEPLGSGGMAKVFLARDRLLDRDVAIKMLREQYADDEQFVERFRREALSAASLSHPNIVQVFDRGETEDDGYFIAMEHVPGGTLKDRIVRDGPLPSRTVAEVGVQVAEALGAAHGQGVIHRDVKPQNVLVTESGDVKVADFGIALAVNSASTTISRTDTVLGTARYMSPEQAMGESATPRSDLYSLGVVLYEMLTGHVPFEADTPVAISAKHVNEPPPPPKEANPEVSEGMNALILKLLAKKPEERYADAPELVADLRRAADGHALFAGHAPAPSEDETERTAPAFGDRAMGGTRRRRLPRAVAAAAALVALLGILGWGIFGGGEGDIVGTLEGVPGEAREMFGQVFGEAGQAVARSEVEVSEVEGQTLAAARERLDDSGLGAAVRPRESSEADDGRVLEQSVAGGEEVERGSRIALAVGEGPEEASASTEEPADGAPDLVGLGYSEAEDTLAAEGLPLGGVNEAPSDTAPAGEILDQDPQPGTPVEPDTPVYLTVSIGPASADGEGDGDASGGDGGGDAAGGGDSGAAEPYPSATPQDEEREAPSAQPQPYEPQDIEPGGAAAEGQYTQ